VRIVTVRAFDRAFRNAMMRWKRKLSLDVDVASVAQVRLGFSEQAVMQPTLFLRELWHVKKCGFSEAQAFAFRVSRRLDKMHGVATVTGDSMQRMGRVGEILLIAAALVALKTTL
jgi:hypothetical protein